MKKILLGLTLISTLFMSGCKDDKKEETNLAILGEWKLNDGDGDVWFIEITENTLTDYDYQGDTFDEGDDCYDIYEYAISLTDDTMTMSAFGETIEYSYVISGNNLTVSFETFVIGRWVREDFDQGAFSQKPCGSASFDAKRGEITLIK